MPARSLVASLVLALLAPLVIGIRAQERPLPDFAAFAAEVKKHLATDSSLQSGYVFSERRVQQKVNGSGQVTDTSSRVFEVYPGLPGEPRYERLVEKDGKPVTPSRLAKDDAERKKNIDEYVRKQQIPAERTKQAKEFDKSRKELSDAIEDLFRVFEIRMVRRDVIDGQATIYATLTPRPDARPQTDDGKIMRHFKAQAWISESDYELVRVDIEAIDTLSFGLGVLARVHKGTTASFERKKVNGEAWLPARVAWTASARVALLYRVRLRSVAEFSNYRRYTVDTSTTVSAPR